MAVAHAFCAEESQRPMMADMAPQLADEVLFFNDGVRIIGL